MTKLQTILCLLTLMLAGVLQLPSAHGQNGPEVPKPCNVAALERQVMGTLDPDPEAVRRLMKCANALWKSDERDATNLLHLARAYYYARSYLQAWEALVKAESEHEALSVPIPGFAAEIGEAKKRLQMLGQRRRLSFADVDKPNDGLIEIDGIQVKEEFWNGKNGLPLNVGKHSISWGSGKSVCHGNIDVEYTKIATPLPVPCTKREICPLQCDSEECRARFFQVAMAEERRPAAARDQPCDRPECEDKCMWTAKHAREAYPAPSCPACPNCSGCPGSRRGIGFGLIGAGVVVAAALGIGFGLAAHYKGKDSDGKCGSAAGFSDPNACTPEGLALERAAETYRIAAYWSLGLGAAAVAGGAVLILWEKVFGRSEAAASETRLQSRGFAVVPVVSSAASGLSIQGSW